MQGVLSLEWILCKGFCLSGARGSTHPMQVVLSLKCDSRTKRSVAHARGSVISCKGFCLWSGSHARGSVSRSAAPVIGYHQQEYLSCKGICLMQGVLPIYARGSVTQEVLSSGARGSVICCKRFCLNYPRYSMQGVLSPARGSVI